MPARIKVDEDLSEDVAALFRSAGFDAISVVGQGWIGRPDEQIWTSVQAESRVFITADKGFSQLAIRVKSHHGLIVFRPDREGRLEFLDLAQKLISADLLNQSENAIIVVTTRRIRIRRT